jgi:hypothetical protein
MHILLTLKIDSCETNIVEMLIVAIHSSQQEKILFFRNHQDNDDDTFIREHRSVCEAGKWFMDQDDCSSTTFLQGVLVVSLMKRNDLYGKYQYFLPTSMQWNRKVLLLFKHICCWSLNNNCTCCWRNIWCCCNNVWRVFIAISQTQTTLQENNHFATIKLFFKILIYSFWWLIK